MLLNIFFTNTDAAAELALIAVLILVVYWFVLRKYNSFWPRMFTLCFFAFAAYSVWIYNNELQLKTILANGEEYIATIISKDRTGNNKNEVEIAFIANNGKSIHTKTSQYISQDEWNNFETGKPVSVIYLPLTQQTFIEQSIMRFKADKTYLWFLAGFLLLLLLILLLSLRKMKARVGEETVDEWMPKKDDFTIPTERKFTGLRSVKSISIFSKLIQAFNK